MTEYQPVEYTPQTYTIVAYYNKDMEPRKISRFADHAKALLKIKQSLLTGQHADIIAQDVCIKDVKKMMSDFQNDFSIEVGAKAIPLKRHLTHPAPLRVDKMKVRSFTSEEGFVYEIRRMKVKFLPGVK